MKNPIKMYKECNDCIIEKLPNDKSRFGLAILLILALAITIRFTPFVRYYWVNWCTAFIVKNWFWALLIGGLCILIGQIDQVLFQRKIDEEEKINNE